MEKVHKGLAKKSSSRDECAAAVYIAHLGEVVISLEVTGVSSNSTAVVRFGVSPHCGLPASLDIDSESNQRRQQH